MNLKQSYVFNDLSIELSFTGFIPDNHKEKIDYQTKDILTGFNTWSIILHNWINFIRHEPNLLCPEIVKNNNSLSLGLIFTDDLHIAKLNEQWRQNNVPTDVLSFPVLDGKSDLAFNGYLELGDIIVSVETAIKQSILNQHSLSKELKWTESYTKYVPEATQVKEYVEYEIFQKEARLPLFPNS